MSEQESRLLKAIEDYDFGTRGAPFPFSAKLITETGWTSTYAFRVIEEYKRFVFLSVTAGHPVSPSKPVDEVWHLHLLYTREYWETFCPQILGRPLHHIPSTGLAEQNLAFREQYGQTLASYERFFGESPPDDIWPRPVQGADEVRSRPLSNRIRTAIERLLVPWILTAVLMAGAGCSAVPAIGPLDWPGPQFLGFYLVVSASLFALAAWLRNSLRRPVSSDLPIEALHGVELAYLNGGAVLTVNAAIAGLVSQGSMVLGPRGDLTVRPKDPEGDILQKAIYEFVSRRGMQRLADVRRNAEPLILSVREHLKGIGLIVPDDAAWKAVWIPFGVAFMVPVLGLLKISIGIDRDRPVGYLTLLTLLALLVALFGFLRRPVRSQLGDQVLAETKARLGSAQRVYTSAQGGDPGLVVLAVGAFGLAALDGTDMASMKLRLTPANGSSSCGDGGGGGGGDGGGGGGGGCGGGCGGCGGG